LELENTQGSSPFRSVASHHAVTLLSQAPSSQIGIQEFAGQTVKVAGTLDAKTSTIDNASIEMAPMAKRPASPR
jgi:hypothetical protein